MPKSRNGSKMQSIYHFIKNNKDASSSSQITETLGFNKNTVRGALGRLRKEGLLEQVGRGKYKAKK